jgi:hypothetical protein
VVLKVRMIGDWKRARAFLDDSHSLKAAIDQAVFAEAQDVRRKIVKGITNQAPGGKKFAELSAMTLALRKARGFRGTKALLVTASLRNAINVKRQGPGRAFVGVMRGARTKDGKNLVNIAAVHEFGMVVVVRVTPKMRAYLMAALTKAGFGEKVGGRDSGGRFKKHKFKSSGTGMLSRGVLVIKIPARPFIGPVIEELKKNPEAVRKRLALRIGQRLGLALSD